MKYSLLLICFLTTPIFSQHWEQIPLDQYFNVNDVALSPSGNMYVAIDGINSIVESKDHGQTWKKLIKDSTYMLETWRTKAITAPVDSLIYAFYGSGIIDLYKYVGERFNKIGNTYYYFIEMKSNDIGELFANDYGYLIRISQDALKKDTILREFIEAYFIYNSENNFALKCNEFHFVDCEVIKVNSKTKTSKLLYEFNINNISSILIDKNGNSFIGTNNRLYKIDPNDPSIFQTMNFDGFGGIAEVNNIVLTQKGELVVLSDNKAYYSNDNGKSWRLLQNLSINIPDDIREIYLADTLTGILKYEDCYRRKAKIINSQKIGWQEPNIDYSLAQINSIIETNDKSVIISFDSMHLKKENNSNTWTPIIIDSSQIQLLLQSPKGILIAKTSKGLYYSTTNSNTWNLIQSDLSSGEKIILANSWDKHGNFYFFVEERNQRWIYYSENEVWNIKSVPIILAKSYNIFVENINGFPLILGDKDFYYTNDKGKSWQYCDALKTRYISELIQISNDTILFTERNPKFGLYALVNFKNIHQIYDFNTTQYCPIFNIKYPQLAIILDYTKLILSRDGGYSWIDHTGDLPYTHPEKDLRVLYAKSLKATQNWYINVAHKGLFKTKNILTTETKELPKQESINIYPSLAIDKLKIEFNSTATLPKQLLLYDINGKEILNQKMFTSTNELNVAHIPSGMYYITILGKNGEKFSSYFVKQ